MCGGPITRDCLCSVGRISCRIAVCRMIVSRRMTVANGVPRIFAPEHAVQIQLRELAESVHGHPQLLRRDNTAKQGVGSKLPSCENVLA
ncbi:hypothetical protein B0H19DRAFT_1103502 [Mycena capillaripes]|nr:hypothetical protein B0H19DRAFT_1103502 [Mycena capillaripes]